ncbi:hypothetical protein EG328_003264 [Venturia inaequalis]|uniref:Uncharacterized protein n=1 Tax=Venturia inaequalis TaxID=5025 RepID=A0A8H3YVE1_VENIN|nr:hypothetical protein EG328_003264 [Venturia inaequalis]
MPPRKLLASQVKKGMFVIIDDEYDDDVDAEICEVVEASIVTMAGDTVWAEGMGTGVVDMEGTKLWFVQIEGVNKEGGARGMVKARCAFVDMAGGFGMRLYG